MKETEILEYHVYDARWKFESRITVNYDPKDGALKSVAADILAVELLEKVKNNPYEKSVTLSKDALKQLFVLLPETNQFKPMDDKTAIKGIVAVLIKDQSRVGWTKDDLTNDTTASAIREWVEVNLHPAFYGSYLAKTRAEAHAKQQQTEAEAQALKEAIDRLEAWWLPKEPTLEASGPRLVDGNAALNRKDYQHAITRFKTVLDMRTQSYKKTNNM